MTEPDNPTARPRVAQIQAGGAAVTVEFSEPLFDLAAGLNACGYDADLDRSRPVRAQVRAEMQAALEGSEPARVARDGLCAYMDKHHLGDSALNVGQYVSLALYLSPPPELTPNVDETELPPQAAQVVNVLPLLRTFAAEVNLHFIFLKHRAAYEQLIADLHQPMTNMLLDTNVFLHQPVSSYDGRRFLVLIEPMLSPALTNARVYGSDYIIVTSPDATAAQPIRMDQIRHIYLHYVVDPMVYSRGQAMERMEPLLGAVAAAPLEFVYKSDVVALITECLIKALEARLYTVATPPPDKPRTGHTRADEELYMTAKNAWDRQNDLERDKLVALDEAQGWVLTGYFYQALSELGRNGGLADLMAPMIYGMDVNRERHHAQEIVFVKGAVSADPLHPSRAPRQLSGMDRAEIALMKGDAGDAADLADKEMANPRGDHARAQYVLARIELMQGDPEKAMQGFELTLKQSHDPRTVAWSHIYLGRLYDSMSPPDRPKALAEYMAALASRDARPDTRTAAEAGIKQPFALPKRGRPTPAATTDADESFDPTGKAEKEAYKPAPPK